MGQGYVGSYAAEVKGFLVLVVEVRVVLLLLLDVSVALQYLINALLNNAHIGHHIGLRDPLRPQQLLVRLGIALDHVEYVLDRRLDGVHFGQGLGELQA